MRASKERARDLLGRSVQIEQQQQPRTEASAGTAATMPSAPAPEPSATPAPSSRPMSNYRPVLRDVQAGETRTYGLFTDIECAPQQIVLHVRTPAETLLLRAPRFDAIDFISYRSTTPGTISCGARRPAEEVYVTWRRQEAAVASGTSQGTAVAVELLPDGFVPGP
jgi:hypothetical protein